MSERYGNVTIDVRERNEAGEADRVIICSPAFEGFPRFLRSTPARRAAEQLVDAVEGAVAQLDYLRKLWGDEGVTRSVADKLRAALAAARDTNQEARGDG